MVHIYLLHCYLTDQKFDMWVQIVENKYLIIYILMENQLEVEDKCILPVEVELEALQAHPDQVVEVKPKAKPRARSKPSAPVEGEEAKPKSKSRAKKTIIEVIPIVEEKQEEQVVEVVTIPDDAVVTKKPKGHRLKNPDTVDMKTKTTCGDCNKTISVHNLNYTHKKNTAKPSKNLFQNNRNQRFLLLLFGTKRNNP